MKKSTLFIIAAVGIISCKQSSNSTTDTVDIKTLDSTEKIESQKPPIDTEYEYTNSFGNSLIKQPT